MEKRKKRITVPVIMQMEALECGAACLAMILAYHGKWLPLEQVRSDCGVSRDGSKASSIAKAGRNYGLEVKAHRYGVDTLKEHVTYPAIIHWNFNHFVVLCGFTKNAAVINDPARGTVKVTMEEFDHSFTGVCIEFTPGDNFEKGGKPESVLRFLKDRLANTTESVIFVMITAALIAFVGLVTPVFSRIFTDQILPGHNMHWLAMLLVAMFFAAIFRMIVGLLNEIYLYRIKGKLAIVSNASFMCHMLHLPMNFYAQRMVGDLAGRQKLNDQIAETLIAKIAPVFIQIVLLVFYFIIMIRYSVLLTFVGCIAILLNLLASQIASRMRIETTRVRMRDESKVNSATMSGIDMIESIKSAGAENGFFERWAGFQASANIQSVKQLKNDSFFLSIPVLIQELSNAFILTLGVWLIMKGKFSIGMLVAFQSLLQQFMMPVENLLDIGQSIQETRTSMERVQDVMKYAPDNSYTKTVSEADVTEFEKLTGAIELRHVTFGYSKLEEPLLKDFNLIIHPGDKVAFVGPSGCGKSTIAKLISGLYEPWEGEILYDGKKINEIPRESFSGSLAIVDQEITLFEDSISENIKMWDKSITDYEVILASRDAQIYQDIMARPEGYEHKIDAGGRNFSGGQCQRFEIARVLAGDPTIVILDEATSALDSKTEYEVTKAIKNRGITTIVVAHRLSTIRDCNEIIVLEHGQIKERGTHDELYKLGGIYSRLITIE